MKNKHDAGFSLIEVLVAIVILAAIVVPTCSSLVLSHKMNAKTEQLMQAQLDVSSAVETLMAEGIETTKTVNGDVIPEQADKLPGVKIIITASAGNETPYYGVEITSKLDDSVSVKTYIHVDKSE